MKKNLALVLVLALVMAVAVVALPLVPNLKRSKANIST